LLAEDVNAGREPYDNWGRIWIMTQTLTSPPAPATVSSAVKKKGRQRTGIIFVPASVGILIGICWVAVRYIFVFPNGIETLNAVVASATALGLLFFAFADACTGQAEKLLKLAGHGLVVSGALFLSVSLWGILGT